MNTLFPYSHCFFLWIKILCSTRYTIINSKSYEFYVPTKFLCIQSLDRCTQSRTVQLSLVPSSLAPANCTVHRSTLYTILSKEVHLSGEDHKVSIANIPTVNTHTLLTWLSQENIVGRGSGIAKGRPGQARSFTGIFVLRT